MLCEGRSFFAPDLVGAVGVLALLAIIVELASPLGDL